MYYAQLLDEADLRSPLKRDSYVKMIFLESYQLLTTGR